MTTKKAKQFDSSRSPMGGATADVVSLLRRLELDRFLSTGPLLGAAALNNGCPYTTARAFVANGQGDNNHRQSHTAPKRERLQE